MPTLWASPSSRGSRPGGCSSWLRTSDVDAPEEIGEPCFMARTKKARKAAGSKAKKTRKSGRPRKVKKPSSGKQRRRSARGGARGAEPSLRASTKKPRASSKKPRAPRRSSARQHAADLRARTAAIVSRFPGLPNLSHMPYDPSPALPSTTAEMEADIQRLAGTRRRRSA